MNSVVYRHDPQRKLEVALDWECAKRFRVVDSRNQNETVADSQQLGYSVVAGQAERNGVIRPGGGGSDVHGRRGCVWNALEGRHGGRARLGGCCDRRLEESRGPGDRREPQRALPSATPATDRRGGGRSGRSGSLLLRTGRPAIGAQGAGCGQLRQHHELANELLRRRIRGKSRPPPGQHRSAGRRSVSEAARSPTPIGALRPGGAFARWTPTNPTVHRLVDPRWGDRLSSP